MKIMTQKVGVITIILMTLFCGGGMASDGVLVSGGAASSSSNVSSARMDEMIGQYVNQEIMRHYLNTIIEMVQNVIRRNNIQIFPVVAHKAINEIAAQALTVPKLKDIAKDAYQKSFEQAKQQREEGKSSSEIQAGIQYKVKTTMGSLFNDPIFKRIVEEVFKNAMTIHRQIIAQRVAQQRKAILQQLFNQKRSLETKIMQQYQNAMQDILSSGAMLSTDQFRDAGVFQSMDSVLRK